MLLGNPFEKWLSSLDDENLLRAGAVGFMGFLFGAVPALGYN